MAGIQVGERLACLIERIWCAFLLTLSAGSGALDFFCKSTWRSACDGDDWAFHSFGCWWFIWISGDGEQIISGKKLFISFNLQIQAVSNNTSFSMLQKFYTHQGDWFCTFSKKRPKSVCREELLKNNIEFGVRDVIDWVERHGSMQGHFTFFETFAENSEFYQRVAKPLLSIGVEHISTLLGKVLLGYEPKSNSRHFGTHLPADITWDCPACSPCNPRVARSSQINRHRFWTFRRGRCAMPHLAIN